MWDVGEVAPRRVETQTGQVWVQVIRRSVRSWGGEVSGVFFVQWEGKGGLKG